MTDQERIERLELIIDDLKDERDELRRRLQERKATKELELFAYWAVPDGPQDGSEAVDLVVSGRNSTSIEAQICKRKNGHGRWQVYSATFGELREAKLYALKTAISATLCQRKRSALESLLRSMGA